MRNLTWASDFHTSTCECNIKLTEVSKKLLDDITNYDELKEDKKNYLLTDLLHLNSIFEVRVLKLK